MRRLLALLLVLLVAGAAPRRDTALPWQKWDPALFDRAGRGDKYILLHMAAVWCHWCHVMEGTTYRDPAIQKAILDKFIPVRVDQDADPELSYRYENWGWPATIMLDKDGNEIFKRRGYIPPELFAKLLAAVIEDPSALPSYTVGAAVDPNAVALTAGRAREHRGSAAQEPTTEAWRLRRRPSLHPWRHARMGAGAQPAARSATPTRRLARRVDPDARRRAPDLIDPVWGGMFQYSDKLDWSSPHFEKLLNVQRDAMRAYVLAWQIGHDAADLAGRAGHRAAG